MFRKIIKALSSVSTDWAAIEIDVEERHRIITMAIRSMPYVAEEENKLFIAAADLFIEKAQVQLTIRARALALLGIGVLAVAAGLSAYFAIHIITTLDASPKHNDGMNAADIVVFVVRSGGFGGFAGGIIYFLAQIAKSLFHEAIVLFNRRHALRFGRLFVYSTGKDVSLGDLQKAFKWTDEFDTAFRHIKTEGLGSNPAIGSIVEILKVLKEKISK
jgi:hypothetical protein